MIKNDEILVVKTILDHCKKKYDPLPTEHLGILDIPPKRLIYLLHKMTHFIEYGVGIMFGWLCERPSYIIDYYKNVHGVDLNDK